MLKVMVLLMASLFIMAPQSFAEKDSKGASDKAMEHANENAKFKKDENWFQKIGLGNSKDGVEDLDVEALKAEREANKEAKKAEKEAMKEKKKAEKKMDKLSDESDHKVKKEKKKLEKSTDDMMKKMKTQKKEK